MVPLAAKAAKVSSSDPFVNNWAISVADKRTARSPSITETDVSIADSRSVWPWECAVIVSMLCLFSNADALLTFFFFRRLTQPLFTLLLSKFLSR